MASERFLELNGVSVSYGPTDVLRDINLTIERGELVALLGSSGCGKTTLLRTIAGFVQPTSGTIVAAGRNVTHQPPDKRGMALMFQSYALWPHMTVAQNIGYGLKLRRHSKTEIAGRVDAMLDMLQLTELGQRKPAALSGGQRQRVALGRALAIDPEILLLDEPLSNLDARIRLTVRHDIRALQKRLGITTIHVTHDREEAMVMADRIVILDAGRIAQQGTPEEVYNKPVSSFVAAFMGADNRLILAGYSTSDGFEIASGPANAPCHVPYGAPSNLPAGCRQLRTGPIEVRFRATTASVMSAGPMTATSEALDLTGRIAQVSYLGGLWRHTVLVHDTTVMVDAPEAFAEGAAVRVRVPLASLFLFPPEAAAAPADPHSRPDDRAARRVLEASEA